MCQEQMVENMTTVLIRAFSNIHLYCDIIHLLEK